MRSIFSERGLFNLIPKSAEPIICLGTAAYMRGWTSVWVSDIKVFVKKNFPVTSNIVPYLITSDIDTEWLNEFPITTEFQTIADLLVWKGKAKMSYQIPVESFAVLFESDDPYPRERALETYLAERGLLSAYCKLREECRTFYDC